MVFSAYGSNEFFRAGMHDLAAVDNSGGYYNILFNNARLDVQVRILCIVVHQFLLASLSPYHIPTTLYC